MGSKAKFDGVKSLDMYNTLFLHAQHQNICNIKFGKTWKMPHIQKLYFVISHENLPILYCRTLFCTLFSITVFVGIVLQRAHKDAHLFCLNYFSCHVLCLLFCFNAQADYHILILAQKKRTFILPHLPKVCFVLTH